MTKYYIMIKCTNNSTCKNVRFFKILKHCACWFCSNHFKKGDIGQGKRPSLKKKATPLLPTLGEYKNKFTVLLAHGFFFSSFLYHLLTIHPFFCRFRRKSKKLSIPENPP